MTGMLMYKSVLLSFLCSSPLMFAMDDETVAAKKPLELSLGVQVLYIGNNSVRKKLEKIYGTEFPLNTIFLSAYWSGAGSRNPEYVPFDAIDTVQENDTITLFLRNRRRTIICRQQREENCFSNMAFGQLRDQHMRRFAQSPQCAFKGRKALVRDNVVCTDEDTGTYRHGSNASHLIEAYRVK